MWLTFWITYCLLFSGLAIGSSKQIKKRKQIKLSGIQPKQNISKNETSSIGIGNRNSFIFSQLMKRASNHKHKNQYPDVPRKSSSFLKFTKIRNNSLSAENIETVKYPKIFPFHKVHKTSSNKQNIGLDKMNSVTMATFSKYDKSKSTEADELDLFQQYTGIHEAGTKFAKDKKNVSASNFSNASKGEIYTRKTVNKGMRNYKRKLKSTFNQVNFHPRYLHKLFPRGINVAQRWKSNDEKRHLGTKKEETEMQVQDAGISEPSQTSEIITKRTTQKIKSFEEYPIDYLNAVDRKQLVMNSEILRDLNKIIQDLGNLSKGSFNLVGKQIEDQLDSTQRMRNENKSSMGKPPEGTEMYRKINDFGQTQIEGITETESALEKHIGDRVEKKDKIKNSGKIEMKYKLNKPKEVMEKLEKVDEEKKMENKISNSGENFNEEMKSSREKTAMNENIFDLKKNGAEEVLDIGGKQMGNKANPKKGKKEKIIITDGKQRIDKLFDKGYIIQGSIKNPGKEQMEIKITDLDKKNDKILNIIGKQANEKIVYPEEKTEIEIGNSAEKRMEDKITDLEKMEREIRHDKEKRLKGQLNNQEKKKLKEMNLNFNNLVTFHSYTTESLISHATILQQMKDDSEFSNILEMLKKLALAQSNELVSTEESEVTISIEEHLQINPDNNVVIMQNSTQAKNDKNFSDNDALSYSSITLQSTIRNISTTGGTEKYFSSRYTYENNENKSVDWNFDTVIKYFSHLSNSSGIYSFNQKRSLSEKGKAYLQLYPFIFGFLLAVILIQLIIIIISGCKICRNVTDKNGALTKMSKRKYLEEILRQHRGRSVTNSKDNKLIIKTEVKPSSQTSLAKLLEDVKTKSKAKTSRSRSLENIIQNAMNEEASNFVSTKEATTRLKKRIITGQCAPIDKMLITNELERTFYQSKSLTLLQPQSGSMEKEPECKPIIDTDDKSDMVALSSGVLRQVSSGQVSLMNLADKESSKATEKKPSFSKVFNNSHFKLPKCFSKAR